jgi:8-oxo-dGTP pyrophosphatase MutT (NUDIX family)
MNIICSGGLFLTQSTKRFLFLNRASGKTADTWGIAGGKNEPTDQTPYEALCREITEEIGFLPQIEKAIPLEQYVSKDEGFYYHTYVLLVKDEFIPKLNDEHTGYAWVDYECWPKPLHSGLKTTLQSKTNNAKIQTILDIISN